MRFLSNNSTHTPTELATKLQGMGMEAAPEDFYLASTILSRWLLVEHGPVSAVVAGTPALQAELAACGHHVRPLGQPDCSDPSEAPESDYLVLGRDTAFSFATLTACVRLLQAGATFYATNLDGRHPGEDGAWEPETGALAAAITAATGQTPLCVGKPEPVAFRAVLDELGLHAKDCLMIGDGYETDVKGAHGAGLDACWIDLLGQGESMAHDALPAFRLPAMAALADILPDILADTGENAPEDEGAQDTTDIPPRYGAEGAPIPEQH